jgi:hypothetical protein
MQAISESELASLRAEAESALPDTCTIQTATQTNTKGSVSTSYASTYTAVPCRVSPVNRQAAERDLGAALASVTDWVLTVGQAQALAATNRVLFGGVTYEVIAVTQGAGSWATAKRAYLRRVN